VSIWDTTFSTTADSQLKLAVFNAVTTSGLSVPYMFAFVLEETTETFSWVLSSLRSIHGTVEVFLTDGSQAMFNAMEKEFPKSHKLLCLWHLRRAIRKHLSKVKVDGSYTDKIMRSFEHVRGASTLADVNARIAHFFTDNKAIIRKHKLKKYFQRQFRSRDRFCDCYYPSAFTPCKIQLALQRLAIVR
jgi:hypothetical protein